VFDHCESCSSRSKRLNASTQLTGARVKRPDRRFS
jgi:hypothetical protein